MWEDILYIYGYLIYFYSLTLILSYVMLLILSYIHSSKYMKWTNDHILYAVFHNNVKGGHTCSRMGLSVITETLYPSLPEDIGVDIMSGVPVLLFLLLDEFQRLLLCTHRLYISDESGSLLCEFVLCFFFYCFI